MSDWSGGYVTDTLYTKGYYRPLNPLMMQLALTRAGFVAPAVQNACEPGFGRGLSINAHAAASTTAWYGNDFIPAQTAFAQTLARRAGSDIHLFEEDFDTFCARETLPGFDFIALHGIWSWVSQANRERLVAFVKQKLNTGGVLYISYNTTPGWAPVVPLRDILRAHSLRMSAPGLSTEAKSVRAIEFARQMMAADPGYARVNPGIAERLEKLGQQSGGYVAHEYLNRDWQPMSFAEVAEALSQAPLTFACSAHLPDHFDAINLSPAHRQLLAEIEDETFRQTVRDFLINQSFRRDYWVRGARRLTDPARRDTWRAIRVVLTTPYARIPLTVCGSLGEATMSEAVYAPVLEALSDYRPHSLGELERTLTHRVPPEQLEYAIVLLAGEGHLGPVQEAAAIEQAGPVARRLNRALLEEAQGDPEGGWLVSPVTGGAVIVPRFEQLFLLARHEGVACAPAELAAWAWRVLEAHRQRVVKDGAALYAVSDNLAELEAYARRFIAERLPLIEALEMV